MKQVGLRELKNRLSHYVRQVRAGRELQIPDRGEAVAELLPPRQQRLGQDVRQRLAELARRGLVTLGAPNDPRLYRRFPRLVPRGTVKRLLDEQRSDR